MGIDKWHKLFTSRNILRNEQQGFHPFQCLDLSSPPEWLGISNYKKFRSQGRMNLSCTERFPCSSKFLSIRGVGWPQGCRKGLASVQKDLFYLSAEIPEIHSICKLHPEGFVSLGWKTSSRSRNSGGEVNSRVSNTPYMEASLPQDKCFTHLLYWFLPLNN